MSDSRIIGLAHLSALDLSPPQLVYCAAEAGFRHVGLRLSPAKREEPWLPMLGNSPLRRETRKALAETGVSVPDAEVMTVYPDTAAHDFIPLYEAMEELGSVHVIVNSEVPDISHFKDIFAELCAVAVPYGVQLGIEFMRYRHIKTLDEAAHIVKATGAPNAKLILDTLHFFRTGHEVRDIASVPADMISFVQLADAPLHSPPIEKLREEAIGNRLAPGEGDFPIAELVAALPADLPVSVEVPSTKTEDKLAHARTLLETAKAVMAAADAMRIS